MTPMLITRPRHQAEGFARALEAALPGQFQPIISPLFDIVPEDVTLDLSGVQALLFTSRNGVEVFLSLSAERDIPAICVGDATTEIAERGGLSAISAQGDASALATMAATSYVEGGGHYLHLRGAETAGDVVSALAAEGIPAETKIIYDQRPLPLSAGARDLLTRPGPVVVPLFSPRTAQLLVGDMEDIEVTADLQIVALSSAVAAKIPANSRVSVRVAERPDAQSILNLLEDL